MFLRHESVDDLHRSEDLRANVRRHEGRRIVLLVQLAEEVLDHAFLVVRGRAIDEERPRDRIQKEVGVFVQTLDEDAEDQLGRRLVDLPPDLVQALRVERLPLMCDAKRVTLCEVLRKLLCDSLGRLENCVEVGAIICREKRAERVLKHVMCDEVENVSAVSVGHFGLC